MVLVLCLLLPLPDLRVRPRPDLVQNHLLVAVVAVEAEVGVRLRGEFRWWWHEGQLLVLSLIHI